MRAYTVIDFRDCFLIHQSDNKLFVTWSDTSLLFCICGELFLYPWLYPGIWSSMTNEIKWMISLADKPRSCLVEKVNRLQHHKNSYFADFFSATIIDWDFSRNDWSPVSRGSWRNNRRNCWFYIWGFYNRGSTNDARLDNVKMIIDGECWVSVGLFFLNDRIDRSGWSVDAPCFF